VRARARAGRRSPGHAWHRLLCPGPQTLPRPRRIVEARERAPILTTQQLVAAVGQTVFRSKGRGGGGGGGKQIHPATRTFQVGGRAGPR
jgi:hypothetical protein